MWNKPWRMAEGFAIGAALIALGLILQLSIGPVTWNVFMWPVNCIVLAVFCVAMVAMHLFRKRVHAFRFLSSMQAAIPTLLYAIGLTIIMGLTRQTPGGTWFSDMLSFWPFVLIYIYMDVILGMTILRRVQESLQRILNGRWSIVNGKRSMVNDVAFLLNHLGLFLALTAGTLGNADMQRLKIICTVGEPEWRALNQQQAVVELPLTIELKKFIMETYDDGSPRRFASDIQVSTNSQDTIRATVDVNKPVKIDGWKIYQYGYDTQMGARSDISILELVSDPWLSAVYTGIYMMLAGAVCMFLLGGVRSRSQREEV